MKKISWALIIVANVLAVIAGWEWNGAVPLNTLLTLFVLSLALWVAWVVTLVIQWRHR